TTALVCILFGLFAYKNIDAMKDTTAQRFAAVEAIKQFDSGSITATASTQLRGLLEPTLTPATFGSVKATHITSDLLTIAALCARFAILLINKKPHGSETMRLLFLISQPRRLSLERPRDQPCANRPCLRNKHAFVSRA